MMNTNEYNQYCLLTLMCETRRGNLCRCTRLMPVVKLLSKRWWIPVGERLEGPKLEPKGPTVEVGLPTADQM